MVRDPLLCNGLDLTFTSQHVTVHNPLLCNGLDLTFIFQHVIVRDSLLCNGLDLTFSFSSNSNFSFMAKCLKCPFPFSNRTELEFPSLLNFHLDNMKILISKLSRKI